MYSREAQRENDFVRILYDFLHIAHIPNPKIPSGRRSPFVAVAAVPLLTLSHSSSFVIIVNIIRVYIIYIRLKEST